MEENKELSIIERFIKDRMYHYALLIDGEWGSGKTYFVREELIPYLKKQGHDVNYISIYGIEKASVVGEMLCIQAIKSKNPKIEKLLNTKTGQITTVALSAALKTGLAYINAADSGIEKVLELLPNYDNNVIIFDDLERCACDINEILGYINNFVEHSNAAVILVANEKEIGKWQLDRNPELQMLVSMNPSLKIDTEGTKDEFFASDSMEHTSQKTFTIDEIDHRRKEVFHNNDNYLRMKEKIVGQTVRYEPDLPRIFTTLINDKIKDVLLKELLLQSINELVEMAKKEEHSNLRTFQFYLEKIMTVFASMKDNYEILHHIVIIYAFRSCIQYMKGQPMPAWKGDYGDQTFDDTSLFAQGITGFKFIDDYIMSNHLDIEYMNSVLAQYCAMAIEVGNLSNDPFQHIQNWWLAEDKQLSLWLTEIKNNIIQSKYSTALYTDILYYISQIYSRDIMKTQCEDIVKAMETHIQESDPATLKDLNPEHFIADEGADIFRCFCEKIGELLRTAKKQSEKQKYEDAIRDESKWASNLYELSYNDKIVKGRSFVYWLEPSKIVGLIEGSNNAELQYFRYAMECFYGRSVYYEQMVEDREHMHMIRELIASLDTSYWGQIKKQYQKWILGDIDRYIQVMDAHQKTE